MQKGTGRSGLPGHTHALNRYLTALDRTFRAGNATEHSYRPALKALLEVLTTGLSITNEPKRQACVAPDYIVTRGPIPLGYIEAKDIPVGIHDKTNQAQFERYKEALPNLIITDYINFELFIDGVLAASAAIAVFDVKSVTPDKKQYAAFIALIEAFTGYHGKTLDNSESLAHIMVAKTRLLASTIANALTASAGDDNALIRTQLAGFRQVLVHNLGEGEFADIFNCVSVVDILKEFAKQGQDPYIHFYETFLAEYNPRLRESRGAVLKVIPCAGIK